MFKRRKQSDDEFEFESYSDEWDSRGNKFALPGGFAVFLIVLVLVLVIALGGWLLWRNRSPVFATEDWFEAMWSMDSETVLDRTCDEEIWVSNAVASGASITGLISYLDITQIPGLDEVVVPGIDLDGLKDEFEVDRSRI